MYRLFDRDSGKAIADVVTLNREEIDDTKPYEIFDEDHVWKRKRVTNFVARELLRPVFRGGECVCHRREIREIRDYCLEQVDSLWEEVLRFENPHRYYVDLSEALWQEKQRLINLHTMKSGRDTDA